MKSEYFGSKFFMGKLAKKYDEPPLHFLQGKSEQFVCFPNIEKFRVII